MIPLPPLAAKLGTIEAGPGGAMTLRFPDGLKPKDQSHVAAALYLRRCVDRCDELLAATTRPEAARTDEAAARAWRERCDAIIWEGQKYNNALRAVFRGEIQPRVAELMKGVKDAATDPLPAALWGGDETNHPAYRKAHAQGKAEGRRDYIGGLADYEVNHLATHADDPETKAIARGERRYRETTATKAQADALASMTPRARAEHEWDTNAIDRDQWISRQVYVNARARQLARGEEAAPPASGATPPPQQPTDPAAAAGAEWDGGKVDRTQWVSREVYVAYRRRQIASG